MIHADKAIIQTTGRRGKTTGRKSTHTVRGPEGQWIAQIKEELANRPKKPKWTLWVINDDKKLKVTCDSEEQANAAIERISKQRRITDPDGEATNPTRYVVEMAYRPIREVVIERATSLGLTAYAIAVSAKINDKWTISPEHVKDYLERRKHMTDGKLDAVLKVLGLRIK